MAVIKGCFGAILVGVTCLFVGAFFEYPLTYWLTHRPGLTYCHWLNPKVGQYVPKFFLDDVCWGRALDTLNWIRKEKDVKYTKMVFGDLNGAPHAWIMYTKNNFRYSYCPQLNTTFSVETAEDYKAPEFILGNFGYIKKNGEYGRKFLKERK